MTTTNSSKAVYTGVSAELQPVLTYCRDYVQALFENADQPDIFPNVESMHDASFVVVSVYESGALAACRGGRGSNLRECIDSALRHLWRDDRFNAPLTRGRIEQAIFEVSVETDAFVIKLDQLDTWASDILSGRIGVRVEADDKSAYFLPSVPLTHGARSADQVMLRLAKKANLPPHQTERRYSGTQWIQCVETSVGAKLLQSNRVVRPTVSITALQESAALTARHIMNIQLASGSFIYKFNALTGRVAKDQPNIVRIAGTAFSLAMAADAGLLDDTESTDASVHGAIEYLWRTTKQVNGHPYVADKRRRRIPLGATALLLLAIAQPRYLRRYAKEADALASALLDASTPDGPFYADPRRRSDPGSQTYVSGEALYALSQVAALVDHDEIMDFVVSKLAYFRDYFKREPESGYILWHACTWATVLSNRIVPSAAEFVFELIDWALPYQYLSEDDVPDDYVGGLKMAKEQPQMPPTASTSVFIEAMIHAADIADILGRQDLVEVYVPRILAGLSFLQRCQLIKDDTFCIGNPDIAIGTITRTPASYEARCDMAQHVLTAQIKALRSDVVLSALGER